MGVGWIKCWLQVSIYGHNVPVIYAQHDSPIYGKNAPLVYGSMHRSTLSGETLQETNRGAKQIRSLAFDSRAPPVLAVDGLVRGNWFRE